MVRGGSHSRETECSQRRQPDVDEGALCLIGWHTSNAAGLEHLEFAMTCARVASARRRATDLGRVAGIDNVPRLRFAHNAETDSQVGVRADVSAHDTLRPLRGQYEVDTERPPSLSNSNEPADKVRQFFSQRSEFVDHDDESS